MLWDFKLKRFVLALGGALWGMVCTALFPMVLEPGQETNNLIRVLLDNVLDTVVVIQVNGPYMILKDTRVFIPGLRIASKMAPVVKTVHNTIMWGNEEFTENVIEIVPMVGTDILVNGIQYSGALLLSVHNGELCVVNKVHVERFVSSLVGKKSDGLHDASIKVLSVAVRTDAIYRKRFPEADLWDCRSSNSGYRGLSDEFSDTRIRTICTSTRGLIMSTIEGTRGGAPHVFPVLITDKLSPAYKYSMQQSEAVDLQGIENVVKSYLNIDPLNYSEDWYSVCDMKEFQFLFGLQTPIVDIKCNYAGNSRQVLGLIVTERTGGSDYILLETLRAKMPKHIRGNTFISYMHANQIVFCSVHDDVKSAVSAARHNVSYSTLSVHDLNSVIAICKSEELAIKALFPNVVIQDIRDEPDYY